MLEAQLRKSRKIANVYRQENSLFLEADAGVIRIMPQTVRIIRVSYSENGQFSDEQGSGLADLSGTCRWDWQEDGREIRVITEYLLTTVNRQTGSVCYIKRDGTVLLSEKEKESKTVESFDTYRMVVNENTQIEEIVTPDGVKRVVRGADRVLDKKMYHTRLSLNLGPDEMLYGLGQAEEGVWNLRHTTQYLHQANLKIAVPFLVSGNGYGILLSTQGTAVFSDTQYGSYLYTEADEYLDYYFCAGDCLDEVIGGLRSLSGKASMLPRWAFGYIQSQERYEDEQEILETAGRFREQGIGLDAIVLDWMSWEKDMWGQKTFDRERFPDPEGMIHSLHEAGVHFMISVWPNMNSLSDNYQEFLDGRLLLPASEIYDAFSEEGRKLYWEQARRGLFRFGVDAWWCDSSEPVTPEWNRTVKPEPGDMYREFTEAAGNCMPPGKSNAYGLYHARAIYEGQRSTDARKRVMNLTRSGFTGSQKYGAVLWSGDISASWETLKKQIAAGLHFCASGLPYWTLDIGAFFVKKGEPWFWNGEYNEGTADYGYRELYVRWFQYGAFLPIFRSHGTDCRREPWNFGQPGEPFYDALQNAIRLRYRLLPYIYSLAGEVWRGDGTMMRLLAFDFPGDRKAAGRMDQYMFGPSLMVCPVTEPMYYLKGSAPAQVPERVKTVYLPAGTEWYDLRTEKRYQGGQEVTVEAGIGSIPVFVKAGAVIPVMEPGCCTAQMEGKDILIQAYAGADGSFCLYEDAGDGYGYEKGEYCMTDISYCDGERKVEWHSEGSREFRRGELRVEVIG